MIWENSFSIALYKAGRVRENKQVCWKRAGVSTKRAPKSVKNCDADE